MSFGSRLIELRTEKNSYQKELATYLNVSIGTISNYEKDRHFPDLETLYKLADYFNVSLDYLLDRTDFRYDPTFLNRPLTDNFTVSDLINTSLDLSPQHKYSLAEYAVMLKNHEQRTSSGK